MKKILGVLFISLLLTNVFALKAGAVITGNKYGEKYEKVYIHENRECYGSVEDNPDYNRKILNEDEIKTIQESNAEKENYEVLVPKTKDNYEIALSYEDGSYTFLGSCETYDNAVTMADLEKNSSEVKISEEVVVPTVINSRGEVVYATESIGRVWKKYQSTVGTSLSYIYTDSSMKNTYTYIHDSFISEVPIIQNNEKEAKVLVAGYKGWMNKDIGRKTGEYEYNNRDLLIQPITNVTNPSYYTVENGTLVHFISISMDNPGKGTRRTIGKAPSYLREGNRYYSYDGHYFYDGSNGTAQALRTLTRDLQSGNYRNSVNSSNPYYNYYNYLPFRSKTSYTADELNRFINNNTVSSSKLRGTGQYFINAQNKYGVNAILALGIAINESGWGNSDYAKYRNNLFGINATDDNTSANTSYFSSVESCINSFAKYLISKGYANPSDWRDYGGYLGNKEFGANVYYASDPYWGEKAVSFAFQLDYELSGKNINAMKDYDKDQLLLNTSTSSVVNSSGSLLYNVLNQVGTGGSHIGAISTFIKSPALRMNGKVRYAILPEITSSLQSKSFTGDYNWGVKGYIPIDSVKMINKGKNYFDDEDINMNADIDTEDLSIIAAAYNKVPSNSGWNDRYDINHDGIIDIYDIVRLSSKL